jgi:hypothetical protein
VSIIPSLLVRPPAPVLASAPRERDADMRGRTLVLGFLVFVAIFLAGLIWTQYFAYYERQKGVGTLAIAGAVVPVADYDGIDSASSPLKLRGCLEIDPARVARLAPPPAPQATPLNPPFWFRCFDAGRLTDDLASGAARAYDIGRDQPEGFDLMLAVYPDGRAYVWRQLNQRFAD